MDAMGRRACMATIQVAVFLSPTILANQLTYFGDKGRIVSE